VPGENSERDDYDMVGGPLSANVEAPEAEMMVGSAELENCRQSIGKALDVMRESIQAAERGLQVARESRAGRGDGDPAGVRQKSVNGERVSIDLGAEEVAVARLNSQLQVLEQGYDELNFLG
jgi:hypothetical protein